MNPQPCKKPTTSRSIHSCLSPRVEFLGTPVPSNVLYSANWLNKALTVPLWSLCRETERWLWMTGVEIKHPKHSPATSLFLDCTHTHAHARVHACSCGIARAWRGGKYDGRSHQWVWGELLDVDVHARACVHAQMGSRLGVHTWGERAAKRTEGKEKKSQSADLKKKARKTTKAKALYVVSMFGFLLFFLVTIHIHCVSVASPH